MEIEIELQSPVTSKDIYELRNYLQDQFEGASFHVKETPPQEGQMSVSLLIPVIAGLIEGAVSISLHQFYDHKLKSKIDSWLGVKKEMGNSEMSVLTTLKKGSEKVHFLEDNTGETRVYDHVNYAIDTDHTHAILIGSGQFEGNFTSIPPIQGNLEDFYHLLTDKLHIGLPQENVIIAYNKSNSEIEEILLQNSRLPDMETLIIYYAGHGYRTDIKKLYLIASNTKKIDDYILGGIDFDFINNAILKSSTAKQKILILDACHSGIAAQGIDQAIPEIDVKGTYILTSSQGDEVSYFDKNGRNTYFTGALLDVLKNGLDNFNKMLALDDLYDYAYTHLQKKNFPHPISRNQLNIPPSKFFIARNPSFSVEKLKRRPGELYEEGKHQEALYEYELLLQEYPDDLELRKEAEQHRSRELFNQLVYDGNELFHTYKNFSGALEKYRKAILIRPDDMVRNQIRKCEERLHSGDTTDEETKGNKNKSVKSPSLKTEQKTEDIRGDALDGDALITLDPQPPDIPARIKKKDPPVQAKQSKVSGGKVAIVIALVWLVAVIVVQFIAESEFWDWYLPSVPVVGMTIILFAWRYKKMSNTEFLIYSFGGLVGFVQLGGSFIKNDDTLIIAFLAVGVPAVLLFRFLKHRVITFNLAQLICGCLALISSLTIAVSILFYAFATGLLEMDSHDTAADTFSFVGLVLGAIAGITLTIYLARKWRPGVQEQNSREHESKA